MISPMKINLEPGEIRETDKKEKEKENEKENEKGKEQEKEKEKQKPKCEDKNLFCGYWAKIGECDSDSKFMKIFCKASCKRC